MQVGDKVVALETSVPDEVGEVVKIDPADSSLLQVGVLFPGDSDPIYFEETELWRVEA